MSEESIIGKFFGVLGLKVDNHGVEEFQKSLDHVKHAVEGIFAVEVIERISEFVERSIGAAAQVNDLAEVVEMSATKIDALGRVAIDNSSSMEAMREAIMGVYRATGQAALGIGRNVKLFQTLGLHAKDSSGHVKSAETVMGELADKFQTMDMAKVVGVASRLGIDPMIAKAMKELGREGWQKSVSDALAKGLLSEADYRQADKTEKTFKRMHLVLGQLATLVANQVAPWLRKAVDAFEAFIVGHKTELVNKLQAAMKTLSEVLGTLWDWGSRLITAVSTLYRNMEKSKLAGEAFRLVLVAIAAVKTAEIVEKVATAVNNLYTAFTKVGSVTGAVALLVVAVGLLVEDWIGFQNGEESVIGDLEKRWPAAFEIISAAMKGLLAIWEDIVGAARALGIIQAKNSGLKQGSMAWYAKMKETPPEPHTQDGELFAQMQAAERKGQLPWQLAGAQFEARHLATADLGADLYSSGLKKTSATGIESVLADQEARQGGGVINTYITGTRVTVQADTDERARTAGKSVQDAMAAQRIRNYQPRGF